MEHVTQTVPGDAGLQPQLVTKLTGGTNGEEHILVFATEQQWQKILSYFQRYQQQKMIARSNDLARAFHTGQLCEQFASFNIPSKKAWFYFTLAFTNERISLAEYVTLMQLWGLSQDLGREISEFSTHWSDKSDLSTLVFSIIDPKKPRQIIEQIIEIQKGLRGLRAAVTQELISLLPLKIFDEGFSYKVVAWPKLLSLYSDLPEQYGIRLIPTLGAPDTNNFAQMRAAGMHPAGISSGWLPLVTADGFTEKRCGHYGFFIHDAFYHYPIICNPAYYAYAWFGIQALEFTVHYQQGSTAVNGHPFFNDIDFYLHSAQQKMKNLECLNSLTELLLDLETCADHQYLVRNHLSYVFGGAGKLGAKGHFDCTTTAIREQLAYYLLLQLVKKRDAYAVKSGITADYVIAQLVGHWLCAFASYADRFVNMAVVLTALCQASGLSIDDKAWLLTAVSKIPLGKINPLMAEDVEQLFSNLRALILLHRKLVSHENIIFESKTNYYLCLLLQVLYDKCPKMLHQSPPLAIVNTNTGSSEQANNDCFQLTLDAHWQQVLITSSGVGASLIGATTSLRMLNSRSPGLDHHTTTQVGGASAERTSRSP